MRFCLVKFGLVSYERATLVASSCFLWPEISAGSEGESAGQENVLAERILVVDHEEAVREIIISMLVSANYECRQAARSLEALAVLESGEEFDLMLEELMMPELDGIGLLERTKNKYPEMPVVIMTGVHDISVALATIRNGAYDYLMKPFEREQLLATVRRALDDRRLELENRTYQTELENRVRAKTEQLGKTLANLERAYDITLQAFGDALAGKDAQTGRHCKRVTAFTIAIARAMRLPKEQIKVIARGAFLHDIGKLTIPDAILLKPGTFTTDEVAIMRQYVCRGYEIIKTIPFLAEPAEIVYAHQECPDGTGYPRGLKGEQIPLGARLVAVANTLDAIMSDLPYRRAQSFGAARQEIQRCSGRQFDPEIVSTFLAMPGIIWEQVRSEIDSKRNRLAPSNSSE